MKDAWVFQINISDGGVPKLPFRSAEINELGIVGDRQRNEKVHGGPDRALCLFSLERIMALQADGNPIYPGSIGENLTLTGLDWNELVPGQRLRIGPDVVIEIVSYPSPCATIADSFAEGQLTKVSRDHNPGWSRLYARVLSPGNIRIGDRINYE